MKILVATTRTQGQRSNDFCWVPEGEPVMLGLVCNRDKDHVDGGCGCARSFSGVFCRKGTTTATVEDWDIGREEYLLMHYHSISRSGLDKIMPDPMNMGAEWCERVLDFCADLEVGSIVEFRHEGMMVRATSQSD